MAASNTSREEVEAYQLMQAGKLTEALQLAKAAVTDARVCALSHGLLATILFRLGRATEAEAVVAQALQFEPGPPAAYDALAHVSMLLGQHDRANKLYRRVVQMAPNDAQFLYNLASSERSLGRLSEAEAACNRAISLDPTRYETYLLRSELRVQSTEANHIEELQSVLGRQGLPELARVPLGYALSKELDDLKRYDEAFRSLREAASIRRRHLSYEAASDEQKLARIRAVFTPQVLRQVASAGDSERYIFIVGLPRSGTTLLEHIFSGLAGVRSNGETDNFWQALAAALPTGPDDVFSRAARADPNAVAAQYRRLAEYGTTGAKIIEKLPLNYLYLGAIHRALPNAKLLLVKRSPLDNCFAMYRTLFAAAYPFSYDFNDLARYYAAYRQLITHWRSNLGAAIQEVQYEELVQDPSRVASALAESWDLPWDSHALDVSTSSAVSLTASAAQIRRPIYATSSGRWRHYELHLQPLIQALHRYGVESPTGVGI